MNFDPVASVYDATRAMPAGALDSVVDCVVAATGATPETRFFEPGIGTGRIGIPFARRGYRYGGADISEKMMAVLREKGRAEGLVIEVLNADITNIPLSDDSVDVVIVVHVLHLIEDWQAVLREARRVLGPRGYFVMGGTRGANDGYTQIRKQWSMFVRDEGITLPTGRGTWDKVDSTLTEQGCYAAVFKAAHWEQEFVPLDVIELLRGRTFSDAWHVPTDVLETVHARMLAWGKDTFEDVEAQQISSLDFMVYATRFA